MSCYPAGTVTREYDVTMICADPGCRYSWESTAVDELGCLTILTAVCPACGAHGQIEERLS